MTMRISIKNEDSHRTAIVVQEEFKIGESQPTYTERATLRAGFTRDFYIHAARRLTIIEDPNWADTKPVEG